MNQLNEVCGCNVTMWKSSRDKNTFERAVYIHVYMPCIQYVKQVTNVAQSYLNLQIVGELFLNSGEVHWLLDNFSVSRDRFVLHRAQKGPRIPIGLQLSQQHPEGE